jgi:hypothetical protein
MLAVTGPRLAPCRARPITGAPGVVGVVTAVDGAEAALAPTAFTARTTKVYVVPLAKPVTTWLVAALVNVTV